MGFFYFIISLKSFISVAPHHNIFSGKPQPLNQDYFKTLWSRFKRQTNTLEQGQTLYLFRHSGAIEIFKRTGSITKLQKAMGAFIYKCKFNLLKRS